MGVASSADIGDQHGLFQPAHGTVPDIAGRGIANPSDILLSAVMMLDWLAVRHDDANLRDGARAIAIRLFCSAVNASLLAANFSRLDVAEHALGDEHVVLPRLHHKVQRHRVDVGVLDGGRRRDVLGSVGVAAEAL
jgi:hypothetical protein